MTTRTMTIF